MVALVKSNSDVQVQEPQHDRFLAMLPQIRRQALAAFRNQRFEVREELIQEVIANSYRAWVLLTGRCDYVQFYQDLLTKEEEEKRKQHIHVTEY